MKNANAYFYLQRKKAFFFEKEGKIFHHFMLIKIDIIF